MGYEQGNIFKAFAADECHVLGRQPHSGEGSAVAYGDVQGGLPPSSCPFGTGKKRGIKGINERLWTAVSV